MALDKLRAYVVGIGPGSDDYVTPQAEKVIDDCGVVVGWQESLTAIDSLIDDKRIFTQDGDNHQTIPFEAQATARKLVTNLALLILGDPLLYPAGVSQFYDQFAGFEVILIPAVGPLQLAAAAARVSLETSRIVMFHPKEDGSIDEKDLARKQRSMLEAIRSGYNLIIMSDLEQSLSQTANFLVQNGLAPETQVVISQRPGDTTEEVIHLRLSEAIGYDNHWKSVMVVMA